MDVEVTAVDVVVVVVVGSGGGGGGEELNWDNNSSKEMLAQEHAADAETYKRHTV